MCEEESASDAMALPSCPAQKWKQLAKRTNISSLGRNHWNSKIGTAAQTPKGMAYKWEIPVPMNPSDAATSDEVGSSLSSRREEEWNGATEGARALWKQL